jgi:hypothetical protein
MENSVDEDKREVFSFPGELLDELEDFPGQDKAEANVLARTDGTSGKFLTNVKRSLPNAEP